MGGVDSLDRKGVVVDSSISVAVNIDPGVCPTGWESMTGLRSRRMAKRYLKTSNEKDPTGSLQVRVWREIRCRIFGWELDFMCGCLLGDLLGISRRVHRHSGELISRVSTYMEEGVGASILRAPR